MRNVISNQTLLSPGGNNGQPNRTTTASGQDFTKSGFWAIELELTTSANRKDLPLSLSGAEVVLDALHAHRDKLFGELESYTKEDRESVASFSITDVTHLMEQIKYLNSYIDIIASNLAADLREIGKSILIDPEIEHSQD